MAFNPSFFDLDYLFFVYAAASVHILVLACGISISLFTRYSQLKYRIGSGCMIVSLTVLLIYGISLGISQVAFATQSTDYNLLIVLSISYGVLSGMLGSKFLCTANPLSKNSKGSRSYYLFLEYVLFVSCIYLEHLFMPWAYNILSA